MTPLGGARGRIHLGEAEDAGQRQAFNPSGKRHFGNNPRLEVKQKAPVLIKDPETETPFAIHHIGVCEQMDRVTLGLGHRVVPEPGLHAE
ncbi:hypothetical protein TURU_006210 [Turdus rufiventris]|nr:hypothetical protein TURU_006210 [Turdus rufiventris]